MYIDVNSIAVRQMARLTCFCTFLPQVRDFLVESIVSELQEGGLPGSADQAQTRFEQLIFDNLQQVGMWGCVGYVLGRYQCANRWVGCMRVDGGAHIPRLVHGAPEGAQGVLVLVRSSYLTTCSM